MKLYIDFSSLAVIFLFFLPLLLPTLFIPTIHIRSDTNTKHCPQTRGYTFMTVVMLLVPSPISCLLRYVLSSTFDRSVLWVILLICLVVVGSKVEFFLPISLLDTNLSNTRLVSVHRSKCRTHSKS